MSPSAPDDHMRFMAADSSASAAFGLLPLPSLFRLLHAAFSASHNLNSWSLRMLCHSGGAGGGWLRRQYLSSMKLQLVQFVVLECQNSGQAQLELILIVIGL